MKYEKNPKNLKAKLLQKLESSVASVKPVSMDVMIIDAMFFQHLLVDLPSTFGSIARYILGRICSTISRQLHFVFDKVIHPSIKDCERETKSFDGSDTYSITKLSQKSLATSQLLIAMTILKALSYSTLICSFICLKRIVRDSRQRIDV